MPIQQLSRGAGGTDAFGRLAGQGIGGTLSNLIEGKIKRLGDKQKTDNLRGAFPNLPEESLNYLASLPPKEQLQVLQAQGDNEFKLENVSPQQRQELAQLLSHPEALQAFKPEEIERLKQFLSPQQAQQLGQEEQPIIPFAGQIPFIERESSGVIPGLNTLTSAGQGFQKDQNRGNEIQSFPQKGNGTMGQAGPFENTQTESFPSYKPRGLNVGNIGKSSGAESELAREKHELSLRKQDFEEQKSLDPFLTEESKEYAAQEEVARIAEDMLKTLRKNKSKWPGAVPGFISTVTNGAFIRDPEIRKYIADADKLIIELGQTRKGVPSNYKLKLEALAKANLSQPVKTQEEILQSLIDKKDRVQARQEFIEEQKDQNGNYPLDIKRRTLEYRKAIKAPLKHTKFFEKYYGNGTIIEDDGVEYELIKGKWVEV